MFFGGLNGDGFADESDYEYGSYSEGPQYNRTGPSKIIRCHGCGCYDFMWKHTKFGWRLAYSGGILEGKIHACPSEGE